MEFHVSALRVIFPAAERVAPQEIAAQQELSYAAAAGFKGPPPQRYPGCIDVDLLLWFWATHSA